MECESALDMLSRAASMVDAAEEMNGSRSFSLPSRPSEEAQDLCIRPRLSPPATTIVATLSIDATTATTTATTTTDYRSASAPVIPSAATAAFTQTQYSPPHAIQNSDYVPIAHASSAPQLAHDNPFPGEAIGVSSSPSRFQCEAGTQTSPLSIIIENDNTVIPDYLTRSSADTHRKETVKNKTVPITTSHSQGLLRPLPLRSSPLPPLLSIRASAAASSSSSSSKTTPSSSSSGFFPSAPPRPAIIRHFIASTPHNRGAAASAAASDVVEGAAEVSDVDVSIEEHFRRSLGQNYVETSTVPNPQTVTHSAAAAATAATAARVTTARNIHDSTAKLAPTTVSLGKPAPSNSIEPFAPSKLENRLPTRSHSSGVVKESDRNHGNRNIGSKSNNGKNAKLPPGFAPSLSIPLHHPSVADSAATFAAGMLLQQLDDPVDDHFAKALGVTWLKLRNADRHSSSSSSESYGKRHRAGATFPVKSSSSSSSFTSSLGSLAPSSRPDVVIQSHILRRRPSATSSSSSNPSLSTRLSDGDASAPTQTRSASSRKLRASNNNNNNNNNNSNRAPSIQVLE